jgi:WD repeat-containing protein 23
MAALSGIAHTEPTPEQVYSGDIDLKEDEIVEQDRSEENEIDDSPDPLRLVSVISIRTADMDAPVGTKAALRRQWEVLPLRELKARSGSRKSS